MSCDHPPARARITRAGVLQGARRIFPFALLIVPFGIAFGVAAGETGLSVPTAIAMSASTMAGAAQLAVLDVWAPSMPWFPLIAITFAVTFAVNARHILMGASLHVWLRDLGWLQRLAAVITLTDVTWAMSLAAYKKGERDVGLLIGSGIAMWLAWILGTWLGIVFGRQIGEPRAFGFDVLILAFFAALLVSMWKRATTFIPWLVAGSVSFVAFLFLPNNWHIIVGALAGGITGALKHAD